jgi:GAF domain-containing protein
MSPAPRLVGRDSFPWAQAKIMANEIVSIPDIAALPQEAVKDMESWRQYGVQSALGIPLSVGGGPVIGMLSFDAVRQKRAWPEPLQKRLQLIAQVFANALDRKRAEQKLRNRQPANGLAGPSLSPSTNLFQRPRGKMIDTTILHCHIVGKLGADLGVV